jgi:hypothetical protein
MNDKCDCSTSYFFPHRKKNCTLEKLMKTAGLFPTPESSKSSEPNSEAPIGTTATDASRHVTEKLPAGPVEANLEVVNDDSQNNVGCEDDQLGMAVVLASSHLDVSDSEGVCEAWVVVTDDDALTPRVTENENDSATDVDVEKKAKAVEESSLEKIEKYSDEQEGRQVIDEKEKISNTDTAKTCQVICVRKEDTETKQEASAMPQLDAIKEKLGTTVLAVPVQNKVVEGQNKVVEGPISLPGNKSSTEHIAIEASQDDTTTCTGRGNKGKSQAIPIPGVQVTAAVPNDTANIGNCIDGVSGQITKGAEVVQRVGVEGADLNVAANGARIELLKLCDQRGLVNMECSKAVEEGDEVRREEGKVKKVEEKKEEKEVQKLLCAAPAISAESIKEETSQFLNSQTTMPMGETQELSGEEKALQSMCTCSTAAVFPHRMGKCAARILVSGLKGGVDNCIQSIRDLDVTDRERVLEDVR